MSPRLHPFNSFLIDTCSTHQCPTFFRKALAPIPSYASAVTTFTYYLMFRRGIFLAVVGLSLAAVAFHAEAWVAPTPSALTVDASSISRRDVFAKVSVVVTSMLLVNNPTRSLAYTPDSDKLRESLYLLSRAQEATVQIERLVRNAKTQEDLKQQLKLKLKLVQASYRLTDQINFASQYIEPADEMVTAVEAGNIAVQSLEDAVIYVRDELTTGPMEEKESLLEACQSTRENLFVFLKYMPPEKLQQARKRVEDENVDNRDEFDVDIDANAGVYNPVKLPWK